MMDAVLTAYHTRKSVIVLTGLSVLLLIIFLFSLSIGAVKISPLQTLSICLHPFNLSLTEVSSVQEKVFLAIRLPRLVQTIMIGGVLGLGGAAMQGLFRNPLVEPGTLGVSNGAALGAVTFIVFGSRYVSSLTPWLGYFLLPLFAFIGGLLATITVYRLSQSYHKTNVTMLILAGVAIISVTQAFIGLSIFYSNENQSRAYSFWTLGDLGGATWIKILFILPFVLLPCAILLRQGRALNAMAIGEAEAFYMGVNVERVKMVVVLCTALAVGTVVSLSGIIAFVGLVVPHMMRMSFGSDNRLMLPASLLGGAILLLISDIFARTVVAPAELPVGIVTAMIGAPFFLYLLRSTRQKHSIA